MVGIEVAMKLFNQMMQFRMFSRYRDTKQERSKLELKVKSLL